METVQNPNTRLSDIFAVPAKFDGTVMKLGGVTVTIPLLGMGGYKKHKEFIAAMPAKGDALTRAEQMDVLVGSIPLITDALKRNYPCITDEDVELLIDPGNYQPVLAAVLGGGSTPDEKPQPGEATASPSTT